MATHDYDIANQSGAAFRTDLNNALAAIQSNNSNSSSPATTVAYQWWADTTNGVLKIRNSANNAWVELLQLDGTLTLEDGSASTPALAFRDDLNTGIYSSAADTFNVATAGGERMELGGTTIFNEDGADVDFRIESDTKTHMFYLDAGNNRIGINTGSPSSIFSIQDTATAGDGITEALRLISSSNTNNDGTRLAFARSGVGVTASIDAVKNETAANETDIRFSNMTAGSLTEKVRIDGQGRLLIGTTSANDAATPLTIKNTASGSEHTILEIICDDNETSRVSFSEASTLNNGSIRYNFTSDTRAMQFYTNGNTERMRIDSNGIVYVGGVGASATAGTLFFNDTSANGSKIAQVNGSSALTFHTGSSQPERMRIDSSGKVSINTTNDNAQLTINGTSNAGHYVPSAAGGQAQSGIHVGGNHGNSGERGGAISFAAGGTGAAAIACRNESTDRDQIGMEFFTHNNSDHTVAADRRLRISTGGYFYFGTQEINDPANNNSIGVSLSDSIGFLSVCRDSDIPLVVGITGSDTQLIRFIGQGSQEGNISISGSTVSYNGGHLSRWSQIKGISTTDKSARPTIYQGTVMSNLDDLCVWSYPDQLYTEQDKTDDQIPEGKNVGDVKKAAHTEENQQLNMSKISDTEGDKDVAGVFWTWDNTNDDYYVNDYYIAMTGDMVIRVAGSTTVARGDLMISAGDGTAKPQADDIIRSSTIAKIISTNATATYADGSKAYPCVLMAC